MPAIPGVPDQWVETLLALDGRPLKAQAAATGLMPRTITDYRNALIKAGLITRSNSGGAARRPWTPEEDAAIIAGHGTRSAAELARELGRTESQVTWRRGCLRAAGRIGGPLCRPWDQDRVEELCDLIAQGLPTPDIARRLRTTERTLVRQLARLGVRITEVRRDQVFSAQAVARLFGYSAGHAFYRVTQRWIGEGYLKARRRRSKTGKTIYHISADALMAFLDNPEAWHLFRPSQITDPDWRAYAEDARNRHHLRRPHQAAAD